ncbi:amidohydrolase family protein [Leucobacter sp. gxy201]|uniref:amidohydrolase family protein n=1 Tax=Leucobacter sp. gxy201 TaxID=2957200 RepID=UPI003D9FDC13
MFTVDNHLHVGEPNKHVSAWVYSELRKNWDDRGNIYNTGPISGEKRDTLGLVDTLDATGVDLGLIMAGDWNRVLTPEQRPYNVSNDYVASVVRESNGRLLGIASVDPVADPWGAATEVERMVKEHDFRAIKLFPTYQHYDPRDPAVEPVYEAAQALDVPVHFHMGWTPVASAKMDFQRPWLLDDVGRRFPNLKVVMCHLGNPWTDEAAAVIARHENFFGDVSALGFWHPRKVYQIIHDFGCLNPYDKLLYGSENPFSTGYLDTIRNLDRIGKEMGLPGISDENLAKILGENARSLYKITD